MRLSNAQAALFTGTIFAGAVLLFWIQPLFTKMALPLLGGSPLVWNTAMVFFQAMLVAGYAYAHVLVRWLGVRGQLVVHAIVLGTAALALPIGIGEGWRPDSGTPPAAWLMALLFASLGAPFFALAATAPLLQRWFSLGRHPDAQDPYFLYAASNAGSVAVLVAPLVFDSVLEYPLCLVLAAALLPIRGIGRHRRRAERIGDAHRSPAETNEAGAAEAGAALGKRLRGAVGRGDLVVAATIAAVVLGASPLANWFGLGVPRIAYAGMLAVLAVFALSRQLRPIAFALCIAALLLGSIRPPWSDETLWAARSFFGVYRVTETTAPARRSLVHGTTNHGGQWMPADGVVRPTTYYTASSPAFEVLEQIRLRPGGPGGLRIGVVGLGAGAMATHRRAGEQWRYFEIDPLIVWLATRSGYFDLMPHDPPVPVVLGDARLSLTREPDGHYDLLMLDAFASDAIPTHLLTREAVVLYRSKLGRDGVLLVHISNRLLDLAPVLAGAAVDLGYAAMKGRPATVDTEANPTATTSEWVILAEDAATLDALGLGADWAPLDMTDPRRWRDDFSNLVGIIRWRGALRDADSP